MTRSSPVICHASGDKCLGCAHYQGKSDICEFAAPSPSSAGSAREVLEQAKAALLRMRKASIAGCEEGYGKPEKWADELFASHGTATAAIKAIDAELSRPLAQPPAHPDVLMNVIQAKLNDYLELHNRGDLTELGEHAWLALVNLQRDIEFALKASSMTSTHGASHD